LPLLASNVSSSSASAAQHAMGAGRGSGTAAAAAGKAKGGYVAGSPVQAIGYSGDGSLLGVATTEAAAVALRLPPSSRLGGPCEGTHFISERHFYLLPVCPGMRNHVCCSHWLSIV
jgi:hypothetical protein